MANEYLMHGWVRTVITPTALSALSCLTIFILLITIGSGVTLTALGVMFVWGFLGIPVTLAANSLLWVFIRHLSEDAQSYFGMGLAIIIPPMVLISMHIASWFK